MRIALPFLLFLAPALLARADDGAFEHHDHGRPLQKGAVAPPFGPLQVINADVSGTKTVSFSGRPSGGDHTWVVSFFAAWCPGCVNEMPMLHRLDQDYRARGVRVLSVSVDQQRGAADRLKKLLQSAEVKHPVALDANQDVLHAYEGGNLSLPYLFVIGPDGTIAQIHEGFDEGTEPALRATLDGLLTRS
jgi:peroxiredoxin